MSRGFRCQLRTSAMVVIIQAVGGTRLLFVMAFGHDVEERVAQVAKLLKRIVKRVEKIYENREM